MALENSERERTTFDATCFDEESAPHNAAPPIAPPLAEGALPMGEAQAPPMPMSMYRTVYYPYHGGVWPPAPQFQPHAAPRFAPYRLVQAPVGLPPGPAPVPTEPYYQPAFQQAPIYYQARCPTMGSLSAVPNLPLVLPQGGCGSAPSAGVVHDGARRAAQSSASFYDYTQSSEPADSGMAAAPAAAAHEGLAALAAVAAESRL